MYDARCLPVQSSFHAIVFSAFRFGEFCDIAKAQNIPLMFTMTMMLLLLLLCLFATSTLGFLSPVVVKSRFPLKMSDGIDVEDDVMLTPTQVKTLRKEANKRKARKSIPIVYLPEEESSGPFSSDTMEGLVKEFEKTELVEVRGISKEARKHARSVSEILAIEVGMEMEKDVAMLELKGHSAVFFSPGGDEMSGKVTLRTSYQPGAWKKKKKAPRDDKGQIIRE